MLDSNLFIHVHRCTRPVHLRLYLLFIHIHRCTRPVHLRLYLLFIHILRCTRPVHLRLYLLFIHIHRCTCPLNLMTEILLYSYFIHVPPVCVTYSWQQRFCILSKNCSRTKYWSSNKSVQGYQCASYIIQGPYNYCPIKISLPYLIASPLLSFRTAHSDSHSQSSQNTRRWVYSHATLRCFFLQTAMNK